MTDFPSSEPGALFVRGLAGTASVLPAEYARVAFGRAPGPDGVVVGADDPRVSREHGALTHRHGHWLLTANGHTPIEFSRTRLLHAGDEPEALPPGYTTLLIAGSGGRKHPLEVYVNAADHDRPLPVTGPTLPGHVWPLGDTEKLVLAILGQQYLRREANAQPMSRDHVTEIMRALHPDAEWNVRKVDRVIAGVRKRLAAARVRGLVREEVPEPIANSLNHNLLVELTETTASLTRQDLEPVDDLD
ncbi:hypothetical protein [Amycolatopsis jejuensis]|uniref:hypothetical protein n=1 Tax=Amycolatopsis jejuensis TaxID=330084 RepID=UPI00052663B7|nr:hypothetical protein [Amycolatopsis jejuensis]